MYFLSSIHFHSQVLCGVMTTSWQQWWVHHKRLSSSYLHLVRAHTQPNIEIEYRMVVSNRQFLVYIHMDVYLRVWFVVVVHWLFCCLLAHSLTPPPPPPSPSLAYAIHSSAFIVDTRLICATLDMLWCVACCYYRLYLDETVVLLPGYLFVHARSMSRMKKT